jgi:hypothetical protein
MLKFWIILISDDLLSNSMTIFRFLMRSAAKFASSLATNGLIATSSWLLPNSPLQMATNGLIPTSSWLSPNSPLQMATNGLIPSLSWLLPVSPLQWLLLVLFPLPAVNSPLLWLISWCLVQARHIKLKIEYIAQIPVSSNSSALLSVYCTLRVFPM